MLWASNRSFSYGNYEENLMAFSHVPEQHAMYCHLL